MSAVSSYWHNRETEFSQERDINNLVGEENMFRYLPLKNCALRVRPGDKLTDLLMTIAASCIAGTPITISVLPNDPKTTQLRQLAGLHEKISVVLQEEDSFINDMAKYERIRTCSGKISKAIFVEAARLGKYIATALPLCEGRVEMLHYLKEQSITFEYHRYGSVVE
jgi:RHH-type proline utilization regulon transcriptional repressor/proline dehydrogenase/delta 1-pyrroline-5-carboxylate dehydrogenase